MPVVASNNNYQVATLNTLIWYILFVGFDAFAG